MEVILLERVGRLGEMGKVVNVRPGFARNFLIPQKKALRATKANKEVFEARRADIEAENATRRGEAEKLAKDYTNMSVTIARQSAEDGKLYGSVTSRDIADALLSQGKKLDRRTVQLDIPIRNIGTYTARLNLHAEVLLDIQVNVVRGEAGAIVETANKANTGDEAAA